MASVRARDLSRSQRGDADRCHIRWRGKGQSSTPNFAAYSPAPNWLICACVTTASSTELVAPSRYGWISGRPDVTTESYTHRDVAGKAVACAGLRLPWPAA